MVEVPVLERVGGALGDRPVYRELDHTADVGVELTARTLRGALEAAAAAMFDLICPLDSVNSVEIVSVDVAAREGDLQSLLVRWLAELLYVHESRRMLLCEFSIIEMRESGLSARVAGEAFDAGRHTVSVEVKAPTYHDLVLRQDGDHWTVRVIFDT